MSHADSALQTFNRSGRFAKLRGVIRLFEVSTQIDTDGSAAWSQRSNARKASSLCHTSQQELDDRSSLPEGGVAYVQAHSSVLSCYA